MRIGELARRSGLKATTIRFYEDRGLLPEPPRDASGYRSYAEAASRRSASSRMHASSGYRWTKSPRFSAQAAPRRSTATRW